MVVETQTDSSVEQSNAAASVDAHQEQAPSVASDEPIEKVSVADHRVEKQAEEQLESVHQVAAPVADESVQKVADVDRDERQAVASQPDAEVHTSAVVKEAQKITDNPTEVSNGPVSEGLEDAQEIVKPTEVKEEKQLLSEPEKPQEQEVTPEERAVEPEHEVVPEERAVESDEDATIVNNVQEEASPEMTKNSAEPIQLPKYIYTALEKVGNEQGFTSGQFKIEFEVGSNNGDGFVGQMFKAFLSEGDRREVFLCKIPPLNEVRRRQIPAMYIFGRETLAYTKFLPIITAYQEEKGVSRDDGFFNVPRCYRAVCDEAAEEAVIIMEDLRLDGYRMWNKLVPVNYEHARLTMEQLGRLHAVSLALKRDRPEEFEQFKVPDPMKVMMPEGGPFEGMMQQMISDAMETLEPHETNERAKMQKLLDNMRSELENCSNPDRAEPYTVLGHGDCWVNNFMFQYKNGAPEKIVLLDWQIARYVSPVLDLVYFLFCCTDEEFRRRHYDEMLSIYYGSLSALLEKLGHNPQEVFPRTALMRQLRRFGRFGILMAVFLVPMLCTRNEDLPDMDEAAEKFQETQNIDMNHFSMHANQSAYHKRMNAVIRDTVRYGYL